MEKIRNLSLRKTIILYTGVSLVCTFLLSAVIARYAERVQKRIWWRYMDEEKYFEMAQEAGIYYLVDVSRPDDYVMTRSDHAVSELCDFLQTYTTLLMSIAGSCAAVWLFYRNKLKEPLAGLQRASQNISENNLDFQLVYENRDEMGRLCHEFERMRRQLAQNNREWWRAIEEEKTLRAAIAHDIRSPLSVLRGYQEMLIEYLPQAEIDMDRALEMLAAGMTQIERMDVFVETMQKLSSLEKREFSSVKITAKQLQTALQSELDILEKVSAKQCVLQAPATDEVFYGDLEVILEVAENLLSNALRYAKREVKVCVKFTQMELSICVNDDGEGFTEPAGKVTEAFYQQNVKDSLKHTGLGMYISRLYCEKHGGKLLIDTNEKKGAGVCAVFHRIV